MQIAFLQIHHFSCPKALDKTSQSPSFTAMKDIPRPSPYGSVYVPPHHRLPTAVTTSAPVPSPVISSTPQPVIGNQNSFVTSSQSNNNNKFTIPYPYLPPHQIITSQANGVSQEGPHRQFDLSIHPGVSTSDLDSWKWKLTNLVNNKDAQEIVSREKKDRRDYEQISALATSMGLHSHCYQKVLVISKVPLPNYRFDLDDKRPQREVALPQGLQKRVEGHLKEYVSNKAKTTNGSQDDLISRINGNGSIGNDEGLFELPQMSSQSKAAIEKLLWRRSVQLQTEQKAWQESSDGWRMLQLRQNLPAYKERETILNAISQNQVVIISGETGCGKTTQIPQFILESEIDSFRGATCSIICTQPRRISTMSVSERIATERGEKLGDTVGYKVRLEGIKGRDTRLLFCTTGILLRRLLADRNLRDVTHVIVDEIHERGMNEDFLLIVLKELLPRRPELRLILMSATLDANLFSSYFGGVPIVQIPGFTHPVHSYFLEDILETTGYKLTSENQVDDYGQDRTWKSNKHFIKKRKSQIYSAVEEAYAFADFRAYSPQTQESMSFWNPDCMGFNLIEFLLLRLCASEKPGAVLVFMTGWDDISSLKDKLQADYLLGDPTRVLLLACHGSMASTEQKVIFEKPEPGVRKIVLATNMAETSITIDDVVFVIDCGKAKETSYDALNNTPCLLPAWISKVSAKQRRGRAGRVQPGECYHLYPRCVFNAFAEYQLPEILRTPLQSLCLQIKTLKLGSISEFLSKALQSPELLAVQNAIEYLKIIGALDENENLTVLGRYLTMLPVEPKLGKMLILGAILNCLDPILTVVAGLSARDPFLTPLDKKDLAEAAKAQFAAGDHSDHFALVRAYEGWKVADHENNAHEYCWKNFLSAQSMKALDSLRREFLSLLRDTGLIDGNIVINNAWSYDENLLRAVICFGLFPGISSIVHNEKSFSLKTMEDGQVLLHSNSVNSRDSNIPFPWLIFNEKIKVNSVFLRDTTAVSDSVLLLFGGSISKGDSDGHLKMLGGYLEFFMEPSMAEMYLNLRKELDELFQCKLLNPRMDLHTHHELLTAVRLLLPEEQSIGRFVFNRFNNINNNNNNNNSKTFITTSVPQPTQQPLQLPQLTQQQQPVASGPGGDNPKSQLQTLLTRAGYPAPIYKTNQLPNNQFRSVCEFNGMQVTGSPCHNKKQAEKDAAAEAIDHLIGGTHASMLKKSKTNHN